MKLRTPAQMRRYQRKRRALIKAGVWYETDPPAMPSRAAPSPVTPRLTTPRAAVTRPAVPQTATPRRTVSQPAAPPPQPSLADRFTAAMRAAKLQTPAQPTVQTPPRMSAQPPRQVVIDPAAAPPTRVVTVPKGAPMPSSSPGIEFVRQR